MMLRVTTYTKHRGRYGALTDRMEYTANCSDHGRLDLAAQAVRGVPRVSAPCMRVQVGYQTFDVSYIAGNLALTLKRWKKPLLPAWRGSRVNENVEGV